MIYTHNNTANSTRVYDVETKEEFRQVVEIDTDTGEVCMHHDPARIKGDEIETFTAHFASIYPIQGLEPSPVMFHCYGRK